MKISDVFSDSDFIFAVCSFLDEFKRSGDKWQMICDEPFPDNAVIEDRCLIAAIAHKLANDYDLEIPEWVNKECYFLPYPIYSHNTKNVEYQQFLRDSTPIEFSCRNIYFGANAIDRV